MEKKISNIATGEYVDLAKINKVSWDSVYVLKPYQTVDEVNVKIPKKYKNKLNYNALHDGYCTLIFTKNNKMVNYAEISRTKVDFVGMDKNVYDKASAKLIIQQ